MNDTILDFFVKCWTQNYNPSLTCVTCNEMLIGRHTHSLNATEEFVFCVEISDRVLCHSYHQLIPTCYDDNGISRFCTTTLNTCHCSYCITALKFKLLILCDCWSLCITSDDKSMWEIFLSTYIRPVRVYAIQPFSVLIAWLTKSTKACSNSLTSAIRTPKIENTNKRPSSRRRNKRSDRVHPITTIFVCCQSPPGIWANYC